MTDSKTKEPSSVMDRDEQMILSLLTTIDGDPNITQQDLATRLGVAVGLVNSYLKRVIYKGYVKTTQLQRRRLRYLLTPQGIKEKSRLTYEFLEYSFRYIRQVRGRVHEALLPFVKEGKKRVILWGSGEVAELAYLAVRELGMELVAVIDPDQAGKPCVDHEIQTIDYLKKSPNADVLLILTKRINDEESLRKLAEKQKMAMIHCL